MPAPKQMPQRKGRCLDSVDAPPGQLSAWIPGYSATKLIVTWRSGSSRTLVRFVPAVHALTVPKS
jgi:hypothetical protein